MLTLPELETIAERAEQAASLWAATPPTVRARALVAAADALVAETASLVATAMKETGLSEARLTGELGRAAVQLKLFAEVVMDGSYLDVRIDEVDDNFVLGVRPDLRRYRIALGPVLNFAASNFPFAFSVAGGDTAAALAAGCSVVVKAHSGHPELSIQTAAVLAHALQGAGAPPHTLQLISGQEAGVAMLRNPRIAAGSFTGSIRVGRMLADIAAARPTPIPFFGELGSVNPVFVTAAALAANADTIRDGFVTSVSGSAGQLCTKPGFLFVPANHGFAEGIEERASAVPEHRLLNAGITAGYAARREAVLATPGVTIVAEGALRIDEAGHGWVMPTFVCVPLSVLEQHGDHLLEESFGPLAIVVEYDDIDTVVATAARLFEGNLTGTIHAGIDEDSPAIRDLASWLSQSTGRVLFGGWPTGVAVTPAMQHGGPWPATTNDSSTSVGTAAIGRFTRPVAFQNAPQQLLPAPLRDDNLWGVPQRRETAGASQAWGSSASQEEPQESAERLRGSGHVINLQEG